jgi:DNA repair exonuclease SbcCD nuclease subunit/biotin operon repressor
MNRKLYQLIKQSPYTVRELADVLKTSTRQVKRDLRLLNLKGFDVHKSGEHFYISTNNDVVQTFVYSKASDQEHTRRVIVTSDWHNGSLQHDRKGLEHCLEKALSMNPTPEFVLHAGDMHDGYKVYPGHLNNISDWTVDGQTDLAAQVLKKMPIMTYGIAGNHDESYTKMNGIRPTKVLEGKVPDKYKDLGDHSAKFILDGAEIQLLHGMKGGGAYAKSYPAQIYLRNLSEGNPEHVPDMLAIGHYHTSILMNLHDCLVVHPSNFQLPNSWAIRQGLRGTRGLYVFDLNLQHGKIIDYVQRFIQAR